MYGYYKSCAALWFKIWLLTLAHGEHFRTWTYDFIPSRALHFCCWTISAFAEIRILSGFISFRPVGLKYEKAKEWKIPCVNAQWLCDVLLGNFEALRQIQHSRYSIYTHSEPLMPNPQLVQNLMGMSSMPRWTAWMLPARKMCGGSSASIWTHDQVCVCFIPVAAWKMPVKITPEAMSVSLFWRVSYSVNLLESGLQLWLSGTLLFCVSFSVRFTFYFCILVLYKYQPSISSTSPFPIPDHSRGDFNTSEFLFCLFRVSNCCKNKRCPTQATSPPTKRPGQCSKFLTGETMADQLSTFFSNSDVVGHLGRLEETHSPTKKLPPESTPQVLFTGFEPTQVQQYTKVTFDFISTRPKLRTGEDSLRGFSTASCLVVCPFLCHSGFMLWEAK